MVITVVIQSLSKGNSFGKGVKVQFRIVLLSLILKWPISSLEEQSQSAFTWSKLAIETLEQDVKYVQS